MYSSLISCLVGSTKTLISLSKSGCDCPPNMSFWVDCNKIHDNSAAVSILLGALIVPYPVLNPLCNNSPVGMCKQLVVKL